MIDMDEMLYTVGQQYKTNRARIDLDMYLSKNERNLSEEEKEKVVAVYIERVEQLILDEMSYILSDVIQEVVCTGRRIAV